MADTNVLVAAAITPRGLCGRLLEAAIDGRWQLVTSPMLLATEPAVIAAVCQMTPMTLNTPRSTLSRMVAAVPMIGNTTRPIPTRIGHANWMTLTITRNAVLTAPAT